MEQRGEIDLTTSATPYDSPLSFKIIKHPESHTMYYSGDLYEHVLADDLERDLRSTGRELLGYEY